MCMEAFWIEQFSEEMSTILKQIVPVILMQYLYAAWFSRIVLILRPEVFAPAVWTKGKTNISEIQRICAT